MKASIREARRALVERALAEGPATLGSRPRRSLLVDAEAMDELHRRVWENPAADRARLWGRPGEGTTAR